MSLSVKGLRRASTEHKMLLANLGEFQARVESQINSTAERMTTARKASDILMAMARAKQDRRVQRRASIGELTTELKTSQRHWGKLREAGLDSGHKILVQQEVQAVRE